jgi:hypothetical protein
MLDELRARSLDQWYSEGIYRPDVYIAGLEEEATELEDDLFGVPEDAL